jgi:hypothetical protein
MKCDFGILCSKVLRKLQFYENWHSKRHTLFQGIKEFVTFSTFCLIWVEFGTVKLSDVRFLTLTLVKAYFTYGHK